MDDGTGVQTIEEQRFVVAGAAPGHDSVELWSSIRLSFEPKGWLKQMRDELAAALRTWRFPPNLVLSAQDVSSMQSTNLTSLVKSIFDGVIAAFHVHDGTMIEQITPRLSRVLSIGPDEAGERLTDASRAVLGLRRLLWPFGATGVQWNPADDRCLAGELLRHESTDGSWRISGDLLR